MVTQFSSLEEYTAYIDGCSLEELKDIASFIDRERYPERYKLLISRINAMKSGSLQTETAPVLDSYPNWFESPSVLRKQSVSWNYVLFPIGIIILFFLIGTALVRWGTVKYRPWVTWPIFVFFNIVFSGYLLIYGIKTCKKLGYWPLARIQSFANIASEFFKSFLILIPINISITLVVLIVGTLLDTEITKPSFIRFTTYTPNSWVVVGWLIAAFTLGPAIEEIFFRGFLYNTLKTKTSLGVACIVQAAIFALCHQSGLLGNFGIFLFGVALAIVYEKRRNLLAPYFVHSIGNAFFAVPLLLVALGNLHPVAKSFEEAADNPNWLVSYPPEYVERKATGNDQWKYAIDTWGSRGKKQWKKEANAFQAVSFWFPEDRISVCKAKLGLVAIYQHYLADYRRAIVAAKELRHTYPDQAKQCASALSHEGWSYYMLREFKNSRKAFIEVVEKYSEFNEAVESSKEGLKWLEAIDH